MYSVAETILFDAGGGGVVGVVGVGGLGGWGGGGGWVGWWGLWGVVVVRPPGTSGPKILIF